MSEKKPLGYYRVLEGIIFLNALKRRTRKTLPRMQMPASMSMWKPPLSSVAPGAPVVPEVRRGVR